MQLHYDEMNQYHPFHDLWQLLAERPAGELFDEQLLHDNRFPASAAERVLPEEIHDLVSRKGISSSDLPLALEVINIVGSLVDVRPSGLIDAFGQTEEEDWQQEEERRAA